MIGAAAAYLASAGALHASHMGHGWPFVDLGVYRQGGQAVLAGRDLYSLRFPGALAFTYPPFAALLFTALAPLSLRVLEPSVTAANLVALPLSFALALRLAPAPRWLARDRVLAAALLAAAASIWLEPVWTALRYGQIDIVLAALVLYDLGRPSGARLQGAALGLAIAIKLTPAIFALYLLLTRRARAATISVAVFAATVLAGFVLVAHDSASYWDGAFVDPSRVGRAENAANQSLRGALVRLLHTPAVASPWLVASLLVGAGAMALAVHAGRGGDDARGYSLCALSALLVSPVSWSHHWVLAVPALMLACVCALHARSLPRLAGCGAIALVGFSHVIWWVPIDHPAHSELHLDALQLLASNAYVLVALIVLGLAARAALRAGAAQAARTALRNGLSLRPS